jgi:hypothetical protein
METNLPQIIGIAGRKFNGKDTVGDYLVKNYGYKRLAFAEPIKDICKIVFGMSDMQLNSKEKEELDLEWNITPRKLMQFIGTELFRNQIGELIPNIKNDIWLNVLEKKIKDALKIDPTSKFVITDVRFENELKLISKLGGIVIKVKRGNIYNDDHLSESFIDKLNADFLLTNYNTLENLYKNVDKLLNNLNYIQITCFSKIIIPNDTLIVLDIDYTILICKTYKMYECTDTLDSLDYNNLVTFGIPTHTNKETLFNLITESKTKNCEIICLTARNEITKTFTHNQLSYIGLDFPVYYCNGMNKGVILQKILNEKYSNYKNIIFVDDKIKNLFDVYSELNKNVQCYNYRIEKK